MTTGDILSYLKIEPNNAITFNYVSRKYLSTNLNLKNITEVPLAFKVKTNNPICYLVKPHMGVIPPKSSIDINVTMQPTDYNPQTASITDKFLVNVISLPEILDVSSLNDPTVLQKAWDVPKNQIMSHKLKVALMFDSSSQVRVPLEGSKVLVKIPVEPTSANRLSNLAQNDHGEADSLMMSFSNAPGSLNSSELMSKDNQSLLQKGIEPVRVSQVSIVDKSKVEDKEPKKGAFLVQKEGTPSQKKSVKFENDKEDTSGIDNLSRDELINQNKILAQRYNDVGTKSEEQKRMLFDLSEENTRLKSELANLKISTFGGKMAKKEGHIDANIYQLWHVLLAAIIAMIFGAYLRS